MCYNNKCQEGKEIGKIDRGPRNSQKDLAERDLRSRGTMTNTAQLQEPAAETTVPFPLTKGGMTYVNADGLDK